MPTQAQQRLQDVLEAVFADMKVEEHEREAIESFSKKGELTEEEVRQTFESFAEAKWGEALADGRISPQETILLAKIVRVLRIAPERLPHMMEVALKHHI